MSRDQISVIIRMSLVALENYSRRTRGFLSVKRSGGRQLREYFIVYS